MLKSGNIAPAHTVGNRSDSEDGCVASKWLAASAAWPKKFMRIGCRGRHHCAAARHIFPCVVRPLKPRLLADECSDITDQDREILKGVLTKADLLEEVSIDEFRLYGSARRLYNFHVDNADAY